MARAECGKFTAFKQGVPYAVIDTQTGIVLRRASTQKNAETQAREVIRLDISKSVDIHKLIGFCVKGR